MSAPRTRGVKLVYVLLMVVGVLFLLGVIVPVFSRSRESARLLSPAAPQAAKEEYGSAGGGYGRVGGMAGGRGGMASRPASEARGPGGGFEVAERAAVSPTKPMLIRTGSMRLRVEEVRRAFDEATIIVRDANGYIADSSFSSEEGPTSATMTVRLPTEGLDSVIERIARLGKVLHKHIGAQEVTEEYVDLTSRKRNLEREEQRLLDLLERAGKVRDLLEVEQTLARVRGEIEQITGRMRYLENRVALSTLTIAFEGPQPQPTAGGPVWTAKDVWREAVRSLFATGRGLATMVIWIGVFLPLWLPLLLVLRWLARRAYAEQQKQP